MTRMTISLDETLLEKCRQVLGVKTKSEAIRVALAEVIRRQRLQRALSHQGQMDLAADLETLANHREQR